MNRIGSQWLGRWFGYLNGECLNIPPFQKEIYYFVNPFWIKLYKSYFFNNIWKIFSVQFISFGNHHLHLPFRQNDDLKTRLTAPRTFTTSPLLRTNSPSSANIGQVPQLRTLADRHVYTCQSNDADIEFTKWGADLWLFVDISHSY